MKYLSNATLRNSLALVDELNRLVKQPPRAKTEHLADDRRKYRHRPKRSLLERMLSKVQKTESCWLWLGGKEKRGYGKTTIRDKSYMAHRVIYSLVIGEIPEGMALDHTCKNPSCVNPAHLEPVTQRENLLRGNTFQARNAAKTHCANGHEFKPGSYYTRGNGRQCKACVRARHYASLQKTKEGFTQIK